MTKVLIPLLILGLGLLLLFSCEPKDKYGPELECGQETGSHYTLDVFLYDTVEEVEEVYRDVMERKGESVEKNATRDGFCIIYSDNSRICYLPKLRGFRDNDRMNLWGHEFAHVVCGDWHPASFRWQK